MNTQQLTDRIGVKYATAVRYLRQGLIPHKHNEDTGERVISEEAVQAFMDARYKHSRLSKPAVRRLACTLVADYIDGEIVNDPRWPANKADAKLVDSMVGDIIRRLAERGSAK